MIIKKLKSIICRWAHDDENKRLREKLRMYKGYLRAANKGAECNARVSELSAARNNELHRRIYEMQTKVDNQAARIRFFEGATNHAGGVLLSREFRGMICCEICGNKRCPHATDKNHKCTQSNAVGQVGVPISETV